MTAEQRFNLLDAPTSEVDFSAATLFDTDHRIAKDIEGRPSLMLWVGSAVQAGSSTTFTLEHLSVSKNINCHVVDDDGSDFTARFSVLRFLSDDADLRRSFLSVCDASVGLLARDPTMPINVALDRLVQLFAQLLRPSRATAAGVWGELFTIAEAPDTARLVLGWHKDSDEQFDFVNGDLRVDVKAATNAIRAHHFSLEQLRVSHNSRVIIASLLVKAAAGGTTVSQLTQRIRDSIVSDPELLAHFEHSLVGLMGSDWRAYQREAFDLPYARANLLFFDGASVPSVPTPIPTEVSDVRFRVDLTNIQSVPNPWG